MRHLGTNFVSPQYHVVYDDLFETIYNGSTIAETGAEKLFTDLFENVREHYRPSDCNEQGDIIFEPPPLSDMWLSECERREKRVEIERRRVREKQRWMKKNAEVEKLRASTKSSPVPPSCFPVVSDTKDSSDSSDDDDDDTPINPPTVRWAERLRPSIPLSPPPPCRPTAPEGVNCETRLCCSRRVGRPPKRMIPSFGKLSIEDPNTTFTVFNSKRQTPVLASIAGIQRSCRRYQVQRDR